MSAYQTEPPESRSLGQIAYEAYSDFSERKSLVTGAPLPRWHDLPIQIRQAWEIAGQAAASGGMIP